MRLLAILKLRHTGLFEKRRWILRSIGGTGSRCRIARTKVSSLIDPVCAHALALQRLERNGLVARKVLATSLVAVEYSITDLGRTLQIPLEAAYEWAINHLQEIERAQEAYDARSDR